MKRLTLLAQLSTEVMQMPLDFSTNHKAKTMLTKFLALIRTSLFLSIILPSTQAIAEYDIDGEWSFTNGISGAAARIRFNTVGTLAVAKLEIAGGGYANDFTLVGESSNNVIPSLCGDNEFISLCISINFESNSDLSPDFRTMTSMRFPVNLTGRRSRYEEAIHRRTDHQGDQEARSWHQG
jgi:hypothetical protein